LEEALKNLKHDEAFPTPQIISILETFIFQSQMLTKRYSIIFED